MSDGAGSEDWRTTLSDQNSSVPDRALDDAPSPSGGTPRRYLDHRPLEGRDTIDFPTRAVSPSAPTT